MIISMDNWRHVKDDWRGFEGISLFSAPNGVMELVCDVDGVANIHAEEKVVVKKIKKVFGVIAFATRADIVDAIVEEYRERSCS